MTESSLLGCLNVVIDSTWKKRSVFEFAEVANKNDHSHYSSIMCLCQVTYSNLIT